MTDPEVLFPPKPGGMVDQARQRKAVEGAQAQLIAPVTPARSTKPVDVHVHEPEVVSFQTYAVSTSVNEMLRVLGTDLNRKRAVIMTLDEPVVVANSIASASDSRNATNTAGNPAGGFVLPVNVPLVLESRGEVWVAATSSTATRVSVAAETYADTSA